LISKSFGEFKIEKNNDHQFPRDAIQGLAKEFADIYSEYLESPWAFWAFSFLTCLEIF